jgi:4-hydroxy-tetrahydrodipicolinate synthase
MIKTFNEKGRTSELEELSSYLSIMDAFTDKFYPLSAKLFLQKRGLDIAATTRIPIPSLVYRDWHNLDALMTVMRSLADKFGFDLVL